MDDRDERYSYDDDDDEERYDDDEELDSGDRELMVENYRRTTPDYQPQGCQPFRILGGRAPQDDCEPVLGATAGQGPELLPGFDLKTKMFKVDELCGEVPEMSIDDLKYELSNMSFNYGVDQKPPTVNVQTSPSPTHSRGSPHSQQESTSPKKGTESPRSSQQQSFDPKGSTKITPTKEQIKMKTVKDIDNEPPTQNVNPYGFTKEQQEKRVQNYKRVVAEHFEFMKFIDDFGYAVQHEAEINSPYHHPTPWSYWVGEGKGSGQLVEQDVLIKSYPSPPPMETWESLERNFLKQEYEDRQAKQDGPEVWF